MNMRLPKTDKEFSQKPPSVFQNTHTYLNRLTSWLINDYNTVFDSEGEGAQVMHYKEEHKDGRQRHLFFKSTTEEPLFAIVHQSPEHVYLLI
jgi:hypothetical protein